jgi:hypothetical protein
MVNWSADQVEPLQQALKLKATPSNAHGSGWFAAREWDNAARDCESREGSLSTANRARMVSDHRGCAARFFRIRPRPTNTKQLY